MIKDINNQNISNKIIKKVSNLLINFNFNVSEKLILNIKESFKDVVLEKIEKKTVNEEKEENYI